MAKQTIETGNTPKVIVRDVSSDLQVKGWDRAELLLKSSSDDDLVCQEEDGQVVVACPNDCVLYVPHDASLEVESVGSDARFRSIFGQLTIGKVGSNLVLRDVGAVHVQKVGTDLSAKRVNGEIKVDQIGSSATFGDVGGLELGAVGSQLIAKRVRGNLKVIEKVGSNAVIRDVDGQVSVNSVGGSLHMREVSGGVDVEVGGSATIELSPVSWQSYAIQTGGSIHCHITGEPDAKFEIFSGSRSIRIKTPELSEHIEDGQYEISLGEGAATVKLTAGSSVTLTSQDADQGDVGDFEINFGEEIGNLADEIANQTTRQLEAQLEMLENNLNVHLSGLASSLSAAGLSEERAKELEERLEAARERAADRAAAAAERARAKLERNIAAAQRKAERKARAAAVREARRSRAQERTIHATVSATVPPTHSVYAKADPVSEGERMMILQMLQEKKISVEQAEKLLSALEGK